MITPLTKQQKEIMQEFYGKGKTKVIFNKTLRSKLWNCAKKREAIDFCKLSKQCPALAHQIERSYTEGHNLQSAVFSECVYAQTFANMFSLDKFVNCFDEKNKNYLPKSIQKLLRSYYLIPRYVYATKDKKRMLIQAGGCDGVDSALITVIDLTIYTIEFKEPGAKASEPDLPKYKEDGKIVVNYEFLAEYPQYEEMLNEHKTLNFFKLMGNNEHKFSKDSVCKALISNYTGKKKFADVVCTEDKNGYLTMIPCNQVDKWAEVEGEIRPAGRNHYKVWTPQALKRMIKEKGTISNNLCVINKQNMEIRKQRGGNNTISGYKISPIFFVYKKDCQEKDGVIMFDIDKVQQLNPTIAAKMSFKKLDINNVEKYYKEELL